MTGIPAGGVTAFYPATQRFLDVCLQNVGVKVCPEEESLTDSDRWEAEGKEGKFLQCIQARRASLLRRSEEMLPAGIWSGSSGSNERGNRLEGQKQEQRSFQASNGRQSCFFSSLDGRNLHKKL